MDALEWLQTSAPLHICAFTLLLFLGGCGIGSGLEDPLTLEVERLTGKVTDLTEKVGEKEAEIKRLERQVRALSALPENERGNPYELVTVRIARITNFYDKDSDGKREKLIVYVQPVDRDGDTIKAAGAVTVQLWNLDDPNGKPLLDEWSVEPNELRKLWFYSVITTGYRLMFDIPETLDILSKPLTVRVAFTDYLTGETFHAQQLIDPTLD